MAALQVLLQTLWASLLALGIFKVVIAILIIAILSRIQTLLGFIALLLFLAHLLHWI